MLIKLLLISAIGLINANLEEPYGYESCPTTDPDVLNVHIVAHSHDDVGWLKTVDQYYYGSRNNIQKAGVQYILDSVVKELWEDPKRKFIYVETAFFWKWWVLQPDSIQQKVQTLVKEGRLQFVGGAWSMNDEAASHYQSTIDQFTWGLSKLSDTFGERALPRVGWQIDPFGHSREFASLLSAMEYDGLFLGRIDYQDKSARLSAKNMEMVWRGDDDLGNSSDIFTGVLFNTYSPPPGFCFDVLCNDEPIIDDPDSPMYNADEKVPLFIDYVRKQSLHYRTNNTIITMGGDFTYQDAAMWYKNLDKLIEIANLKSAKDGLNIKLFYSTPNCYLKSVKESNPSLPTKQDDFFPYASDPNSYWTGYFTSRPTTKYFEREGNNYLQMIKQLQVLAGLQKHNIFVLNELKSAMGVMQHHDAITGTEKQHVTHDYERMLNQAIDDGLIIASQALNKFMQNDTVKPPMFSYDRCHLNESSCDTSENSERFVVTVYNSIGWYREEPIHIPVLDGTYEVYAPNGEKIDSQLVDLPEQIIKIPTRQSKATHEIVFIAYLHPLSYKSYYIKKITKTKRETKNSYYYRNLNDYWKDVKEETDLEIKNIEDEQTHIDRYLDYFQKQLNTETSKAKSVNREKDIDIIKVKNDYIVKVKDGDVNNEKIANQFLGLNDEEMRMLSDDPMVVERFGDDAVFIENQHIKLQIENATGQITNIILPDGNEINFTIHFHYYPGCLGNNEIAANRSSGAYIFRPNATKPTELTYKHLRGAIGTVVKENRVEMPNALSVVRVYDKLDFIEHEWVIGPIPIEDGIGKEYIVRYVTDIINNGEFYTDSNGRQMLKRKLNERPQWNVTLAEPVGGNYYPVTNEIFIENDASKLVVLTDRSQGGSSLIEGSVELMLHRRLLHDDAFGVGEALNETANGQGLVVRGKHRILLSSKGDSAKERKRVLETHSPPIVFVSDATNVDYERWLGLKKAYSWLNKELPEGVHLLTVEPLKSNLLLRLENYLSKSENSTVEVDLATILKNINVKSVKELSLSGTELRNSKWVWTKNDDFVKSFNDDYGHFGDKKMAENIDEVNDDGLKIKIRAKEIRTFKIEYDYVDL